MTNSEAQTKDTSVDTSHGCILYIEGLTVSFDGFKALNDLNLYIDEGELRCIIGPNGAGKTTIGMLLVQDPRLLLIDEPVAGMTHQETERTAELLASLAGKHSVVVVEHEMDFIRSIANRVTVLHEGSVLAEGKMEDVQKDPKVMEVYLGS